MNNRYNMYYEDSYNPRLYSSLSPQASSSSSKLKPIPKKPKLKSKLKIKMKK